MEIKQRLREALAEYFQIDTNGYDWESGCTIQGKDGNYRWMTLNNIVMVLEDVVEEIAEEN